MSRAIVIAGLLAVLPPTCAKVMGKAPPPVEADVPAPPPVAIASATAPPVWSPPEPVTVPGAPSPPPAPAASADLVKARAAAEGKDFKKVRSLLEKKVRAGKGVPEEAQLVFRACTALKDKPCADAVRAKQGEDE